MSNPTKTSQQGIQDMIESEQISIIQRITRVQALQIVLVLLDGDSHLLDYVPRCVSHRVQLTRDYD